jgi:GNAT superfamily N-acetyltransferase
MVDLGYIISPVDTYSKLRMGIKNEEEQVRFYSDFIILKTSAGMRVLLVEKTNGIVAGVHYKKENGLNTVAGMYTKPNHRRKGYMSKLISFVEVAEKNFTLGNDFTHDGEAFANGRRKNFDLSSLSIEAHEKKSLISEAYYNLELKKLEQGMSQEDKQKAIKNLKKWQEVLKRV